MSLKPSSLIEILHLEDQPEDVELCRHFLESAALKSKATRVERREEFASALQDGNYDIIISDFTLPGFDGLGALEIARDLRPEIPFVFYSGTIGEEAAIDALKQGASDYVLKNRPLRLASAVQRALREAEERRHRIAAERALHASEQLAHRHLAELQTIYRQTPAPLCCLDTEGHFITLNESFAELAQRPVAEFVGRPMHDLLPALAEGLEAYWERILETGQPLKKVEIRAVLPCKEKVPRHWLANMSALKKDGAICGINTALFEITPFR